MICIIVCKKFYLRFFGAGAAVTEATTAKNKALTISNDFAIFNWKYIMFLNKIKNSKLNRYQIETVQTMFWIIVSFEKTKENLNSEVTSETETVECVMPLPYVRIPFILARLFMLTSPELVSVTVVRFFFSSMYLKLYYYI